MSRTLAYSANWFGIVCLAGAFATSVALALSDDSVPSGRYWLAAAVMVPMAVLLVWLSMRRTRWLSIAYLVVGGVATYVYAFALLSDHPSFATSNLFVIALPKMALVMIGGVGSGALIGAGWTTVGWAMAVVASYGAALVAGSIIKLDTTTLVTYVLMVALLYFDSLSRRTARVAQDVMHRAARDDRQLQLRRELELRAAAHLHDTALSQLILIAESPTGPLDARLSEQIASELEALVAQDWLLAPGHSQGRAQSQGGAQSRRAGAHSAAHSAAGVDDSFAEGPNPGTLQTPPGQLGHGRSEAWQLSELQRAIEHVQARNLKVLLSGDPDAVGGLDHVVDVALGQALRQCLVNVVRHAGVSEVDVTILAARDDLTVIVVDDGVGFELDAAEGTDPGGLGESGSSGDPVAPVASVELDVHVGLTHSVRHRIEALGGAVEVWSQPGVGTSVMMSVPWSVRTRAVEAP